MTRFTAWFRRPGHRSTPEQLELEDVLDAEIQTTSEPSRPSMLEPKGAPTVKYTDKHYEKVAKMYAKHGTVAKVQDHYPWASYSAVSRWVRECRKRGLLPEKTAKK